MREKIIIGLGIFLLIAVGMLVYMFNLVAKERRETDIVRSNLAASQDTLREYKSDKDSLTHTLSLMAYQHEIDVGELDLANSSLREALRQTDAQLRTISRLSVQIDSLSRRLAAISDTTDSAGVRYGSTDVVGPPIEGTIAVEVPPRPQTIAFQVDLRVTPFELLYGISCDGQRRAHVNVQVPRWISLTMGQGTVAPDVCHPYKPVSIFSPKITAGGTLFGALAGAIAVLIIK